MSCAKFGFDRWRRSPSARPNPLVGFRNLHACWHADLQRPRPLNTPLDSSSFFATSKLFPTLFLCSGFNYRPSRAFNPTQNLPGQLLCPVLQLCSNFFGCSFFLQAPACSPLFAACVPLLRNQIVAGASLDARTRSLHSQLSFGSLYSATFGVLRQLLAASEFPHESITRNNNLNNDHTSRGETHGHSHTQ